MTTQPAEAEPKIKKVIVRSFGEAEDLIEPKSARRKSICDKHPDHKIQFWLESSEDEPLLLMYTVSNAPGFKPKQQRRM